MNMNFYNPTNVITGKNCVRENAALLADFGKKCLIVTGRNSAKKSGALGDVTAALQSVGIAYTVFDEIEQNPSYDSCVRASALAKSCGAEFVIGIGGGSPLDAAKAIAALAANEDNSPEALYSAKWPNKPLTTIAVGTTAGTGSEVSPVSVITNPKGQKQSFRAPSLYPTICFGDATYTMSLSAQFTCSTALDALAHCIESYFNKTANEISRTFALRGTQILLEMLTKTAKCDIAPLTYEDREQLYFASLYGGYSISVTGTAFPHTLGYVLSEEYGICHGNACACYLEEFIRYNAEVAPKETESFFTALRTDKDTLISLIQSNLPALDISMTEEKIAALAPRYKNNKSILKCLGAADEVFACNMLRKMFLDK